MKISRFAPLNLFIRRDLLINRAACLASHTTDPGKGNLAWPWKDHQNSEAFLDRPQADQSLLTSAPAISADWTLCGFPALKRRAMPSVGSSQPVAASTQQEEQGTFRGPFAIMTILFFMWGFMTVFNDILIPRFKSAFELNYFEAMLVQFAFFGAYFTGAFLYFIISAFAGDPIARLGYKNGVVIGLLISAAGSAIFWPAASAHSYRLFLLGLFVVGLGFAVLQIAANPYVTILGPERTASSRLNLAQAFNSVGTTTGPLIGGYLIFQYFDKTGVHGAESVRMPYLAFCAVFLILAFIFFFIHLPHVGEGKIERGAGALRYPHVTLGILAIFMYVGGEVSVGSAIINFLGQPTVARLSELEASKHVSL